MSNYQVDPFAGLTPEDLDRAIAYQQNQRAIRSARLRAARALLAPPGPAEAVRAAWAPVRAIRRAGGGSRAID